MLSTVQHTAKKAQVHTATAVAKRSHLPGSPDSLVHLNNLHTLFANLNPLKWETCAMAPGVTFHGVNVSLRSSFSPCCLSPSLADGRGGAHPDDNGPSRAGGPSFAWLVGPRDFERTVAEDA